MIEQEFSEVAQELVQDVGKVTSGDEVLIVTDPLKIHIARSISSAVRANDATSVIALKPRLDAHGNELPESVGNAMLGADIVFDVNTYAITHTNARRRASEEEIPFIILRGVTDEILLDHMNTDYEELREVTRAVATIQSNATTAYVSSEKGTDVTMDLTDRSGFPFDDDYTVNGFVGIPAGKSAVTPVEGTTEGSIVIDYSFDNIGKVDEPIEMTVEEGRVVEIEGGAAAEELQTIVQEGDEGARNIAEAPSLGTNKDVKLIGNQASDKKKRGTVHFAIGDNVSLGGSVQSETHLDATMLNPTVEFDGEEVLNKGDFNKEKVINMAKRMEEK